MHQQSRLEVKSWNRNPPNRYNQKCHVGSETLPISEIEGPELPQENSALEARHEKSLLAVRHYCDLERLLRCRFKVRQYLVRLQTHGTAHIFSL